MGGGPGPAAPVGAGPGVEQGASAPPPAPAPGVSAAPPAPASGVSAAPPAPPAANVSTSASAGPSLTVPPPGETRYIADQLIAFERPGTSPATISAIVTRHRLVAMETATFSLTGFTAHLWRIPDRRPVATVERELASESALARVQPNFLYASLQGAPAQAPAANATAQANAGLYALDALDVPPAAAIAGGRRIKVALIDTAVDEKHPDLAGVVAENFDAIGNGPPLSLDHGTAMAGAIAARGRVRGVAPGVELLAVRAFDSDGKGGALGNTFAIMKGVDWAAREGAEVVNMSFAGPPDPALHDMLAAAAKRGAVLIGAMGNAGPKSPPLYPAADANVIAITAVDAQDKPYGMANVGPYVAAAAPGVDVLLPAPDDGYALETGTSVSAALASGVAALALQSQPKATVNQMREWLTLSARPLGGAKAQVGAGLIDAAAAIKAAKP
ncbi:MAG: S8 family peptidase [Roseiarcus sp.]